MPALMLLAEIMLALVTADVEWLGAVADG